MNNNYTVYKHTFPNGKCYIGITMQTPERRFMNGKGYKDCPKMNAAILKYGWNNVEHELLFDGLSKQEAEAKEIELIVAYNSIENGYNIEHGGNVPGTHSIETRRKISVAGKGKRKPPRTEEQKAHLHDIFLGERNPFYGKHHAEETKTKHSDFMKGNQYNRGNHHTDAYKRWKSEQMREKYKDGGNPRCKAVCCVNAEGERRIFDSLRDAAKTMSVSVGTMYRYVHSGKKYLGCKWGYANET